MNIVVPMAGKSIFFEGDEYKFPKPLIEIGDKTMIQLSFENLNTISEKKHFIYILNEADCIKYHLDSLISIMMNKQSHEIKILKNQTQGAAATVLFSVDQINNDEELIICNYDQLFNVDLNEIIKGFRKNNYEAAVITFNTLHPRWSYVLADDEGLILEASEKKPISNNAIAGFYYFQNGSFFVEAAMNMIKKDANVDGLYFIAPSLNELVLKNKRMGYYEIPANQYHTFYSPQKIKNFETLNEKR